MTEPNLQPERKASPKKSLVYRRCENIFHNLVLNNVKEISRQDTERLIREYIGGSPQTRSSYLHNFIDFEFLKTTQNPNIFTVN